MAQNVARVWNTGTPENPIFNFELPSGAKGEPGGWTNGAEIGTTDLDDIITPGLYKATSASNVTAERHYPIAGSQGTGILEVMWQGNTTTQAKMQRYTIIWGNSSVKVMFLRHYTSATWGPWHAITSQRVDTTAGRVIYTWDEVNAREQMIYSDTGWRDISANLITDNFVLNSSQPRCHIRREGSDVSLVMRLQASASLIATGQGKSSTLMPALDIPAGFTEAPISYSLTMTGIAHAGASIEALGIGPTHTNTQLRIAGTTDKPWTANAVLGFNLRWKTNAVWPTSLPGIAA